MSTNTNRLLAAVLVLQVLTLAGQFSGRAGSTDARADLPPNPSERQLAMTEELKAKGVSDFVHIRCDLLETLTRYHEKFGIPPMPVQR